MRAEPAGQRREVDPWRERVGIYNIAPVHAKDAKRAKTCLLAARFRISRVLFGGFLPASSSLDFSLARLYSFYNKKSPGNRPHALLPLSACLRRAKCAALLFRQKIGQAACKKGSQPYFGAFLAGYLNGARAGLPEGLPEVALPQ